MWPTNASPINDRQTTRAVKLYGTADDAAYKLDEKSGNRTIYNLRYKDYIRER